MKVALSPVRVFTTTIIVIVAAIIVIGLVISGSPTAERMRRFDAQRLSDLQQITYAIDNYWNTQQQILPSSLETLQTTRDIYLQSIRDPKTGIIYSYTSKTVDRYELCADFETSSTDQGALPPPSVPTQPASIGATPTFWNHGIGRTCYALSVHKNTPPTPTITK